MVKRRPVLAVVAVAATLLTAACGSGSPSGSTSAAAPTPPSSAVGTEVDRPLPNAVLSLPLVDTTGRQRSLSTFRGKLLVISDAMSLCQETCPLDTTTLVETARAVEKAGLGDYVQFLSITVDPARDTTTQLAAYKKLYRPAPADWSLLTGPVKAINTLWDKLGVYRQKVPHGTPPPKNWRTGKSLTYDIDHSDEVFFVDTAFHDRFVLEGPPHVSDTAAVPPKLTKFLDAKGRQNLDHPASTAWTEPQALQVLGWLLGKRISG